MTNYEDVDRLLFEQAPVGLGQLSLDGVWQRANGRMCVLLGCLSDSLIGKPVTYRALADALDRARRTAGVQQLELFAAGNDSWVTLTVAPLRASVDDVVGLVVVAEPSARDDFLTIAAHELRTPVTPLRLHAASLRRELARWPDRAIPPDRLARGLDAIDRAAGRLAELVARLLDVSRLASGSASLEREDVDLVGLVRNAIDRAREDAALSGSNIFLYASDGVIGRWDRDRLDLVVTNLLANAIKYGLGKPIEVWVDEQGGKAWLTVRDQGIGVPTDAKARLFQRYHRVATQYSGFGLGLWIAREIVEAHGGRIAAECDPDGGSRFTIELPLLPASEVSACQ
jgi:signal transduction histidine kinase